MKSLEEKIGYTFKDKELLKKALTHTSYAYEHGIESNEKLEFLGDSILEFLSSKYIYNNYNDWCFNISYIFIIKTDGNEVKSFSYRDVLTNTIELFFDKV